MERSVNIADKTTLDLVKIDTTELCAESQQILETTNKILEMAESGEIGGGGGIVVDPSTGRYTITTIPSPAGSLAYTGTTQSPIWSNFNADVMEIGGTTSAIEAGTYYATFTPKEGYQWSDKSTTAKEVAWVIDKAKAATPAQSGSLTYNGNAQSPVWINYDPEKMTISGQTSATDAGTYTATFTLTGDYTWSDGSTDPKQIQWSIGKATVTAVPTQSGSLVYNGSQLTPSWNNYDSSKLTIGGQSNGTNAGSYTATFTPTKNYQWSDGGSGAKNATWSIQKATLTTVPSQSGSLTYNGSAQSPTWSNYNSAALTIGGTNSATDAGTYQASFTPTANYQWSDGTGAKTANWTINKAAGSLTLSNSVMELTGTKPTASITVTRPGDGAISIENNNTTAVTASLSGNTISLTGKANGSATITVKVAAGKNYTAPSNKTITVTVSFSKTYGIRIAKNDSNPSTRVTYTDDAVGMTPAKMNFGGSFDYGDWADAFFVKNNYPCMLNADGSVAYKLNPNDYTKRENGQASDVSNTSFNGNAMSAIPLTYVYAYEDSSYEYIKISDSKVDNNYQAIAHTRSDGSVRNEIFLSIYKGSLVNNKLRSISGQNLIQSYTAQQEMDYAEANGANWNVRTWSQRTLINYMLMIMGKSTDTQAVFGQGNTNSGSSSSNMIKPGASMNQKGQFWGASNKTSQVKVFHMEDWWGNQWERIAGLILDNMKYKVSMHGPYNVTGSGYTTVSATVPGSGWIQNNTVTQYGRFPKTTSGSSTTYDCDYFYSSSGVLVAIVGGYCNDGDECGAFFLGLAWLATYDGWSCGACLSFV